MIKIWKNYRLKISEILDRIFFILFSPIFNMFFEFGRVFLFSVRSLRLSFSGPSRFSEIVKHVEFIANKSVLIIALTAGFTGMAMSYQIYLGFNLVNATNLVGPTVGLGITRELGPVLTGLIVAARAGGSMAARLGTMRVTEQIDALSVMGINPRQYLVAPRIIAAIISMPFLCGLFDFVAMSGAYFLCVNLLGLDAGIFFDKIQSWLGPGDINEGLVKATVFGFVFSSICTHRGFFTSGGAKGVGEATNQGVVNSMVLIIAVNFLMTNVIRVFNQFWKSL